MTTYEPNDQELVAAANGGDEAAFAILCRRYLPNAYNVAFGILAGFPDARGQAEDAVQITLTGFGEMFPGFPHSDSPRQAVIKLAVRAARGLRDKARRRREYAEVVDPPAPPSVEPDPLLRDLVRAAVESLSDALRDVVVLRYWRSLSYEEIAEALDIPLGTVRSRLYLAAKVLRDDPRLKGLEGLNCE
ncbi:MAG: RNA polymerase sigma factor [Phycisphaerae bacterium]|nr:RNA polymerase sigma factor [Phycisphaerae bacterium]MCK6497914.1 RNA polymerase sigma factor [Nitrospira sp.]